MKNRAAEKGMTLLETLVSLLLLGMIASLGTVLLPMMKRAAERSGEYQRRAAELGRTHDFIRALIENALTVGDLGAAAAKVSPLAFESSHLDLLTTLPAGLGPGGLYRVSFTVEGSGRKHVLRLHVTPLRPDQPQAPEGDLIEDAAAIEWSYFDASSDSWRSQGPTGGALPDLIRLSVDTPETGRWPPLIAGPMLGGGALCAFDAVTGTCRRTSS